MKEKPCAEVALERVMSSDRNIGRKQPGDLELECSFRQNQPDIISLSALWRTSQWIGDIKGGIIPQFVSPPCALTYLASQLE